MSDLAKFDVVLHCFCLFDLVCLFLQCDLRFSLFVQCTSHVPEGEGLAGNHKSARSYQSPDVT